MKNNLLSLSLAGVFVFSVLSPSIARSESKGTHLAYPACETHEVRKSIYFWPLPDNPMNPVGVFVSGNRSVIQFKTPLSPKTYPELFVWQAGGYVSTPYNVCGKEIIFNQAVREDHVLLMFKEKGKTNFIKITTFSGVPRSETQAIGVKESSYVADKASVFCTVGQLTDIVVHGRVLKFLTSDPASFDISTVYLPLKGETHVVVNPINRMSPFQRMNFIKGSGLSFTADLILFEPDQVHYLKLHVGLKSDRRVVFPYVINVDKL